MSLYFIQKRILIACNRNYRNIWSRICGTENHRIFHLYHCMHFNDKWPTLTIQLGIVYIIPLAAVVWWQTITFNWKIKLWSSEGTMCTAHYVVSPCSAHCVHKSIVESVPRHSRVDTLMSGDQLSAQNSLKDNIKFLDSLLEIDFYSLTIIFFPRLFLDITIFFTFSPWQNRQFLDCQG